MIFHENRLLADDSHVISYLIFVENWERCLKNLSSAAVVIGALRVNVSLGVSIIHSSVIFLKVFKFVEVVSLFDLIFYVPSTIFQL